MTDAAAVNLDAAFARITEPWTPRIAAELNGQHVKLAVFNGRFVWHHHDDADEMFFVARGMVLMHLRDRTVTINAGEFFVVPRGVEHCPEAPEDAWVMLFEPAGTRNTGNAGGALTVTDPEPL